MKYANFLINLFRENTMARAGENQNFFGFADDKLIYDERKKRFVHTTDMPGHLSR